MIKLERPLICFDLETTGIDVSKDRIVEISLVKILPNGDKDVKTRRVNPTIPIPKEAFEIHNISDDDVKDCATFVQIAKSLQQWIENCDLAGFNSNRFDIPLLMEEFARADIHIDTENIKMIDVQTIYHKMEPRTLSAAYKFYCDKEIVNAHSAQADVEATYEVLLAQMQKYKDLPENIDDLAQFCKQNNNMDMAGRIIKDSKGIPVFNFGKHKGKPVKAVFERESSYYDWIMKGDFTQNTKSVITKIMSETSK